VWLAERATALRLVLDSTDCNLTQQFSLQN